MRKSYNFLLHRLSPMLVRAWMMLWILSVPLFHIHPEFVEHSDHGEALRSGTVHTVFSGDLDGEFESHEASAHSAADKSTHLSHVWFEHSEFGISLITDSHHRTDLKPILVQTMVLPVGEALLIQCCELATTHRGSISLSTFTAYQLSPRAPPSLLL